jgi:hypothetical protein
MNNYLDIITERIKRFVPKGAVDLRFNDDSVDYLHPTKGWRRVSLARMGLKSA